jgi:hypothetical protein
MDEVNNNPVVHLDVWVTSHLDVGAHNPFPNGEQEVVDALMSANGVWPISAKSIRAYTYERERLMRLELWKNDYDLLLENEVFGWSQYSMRISDRITMSDNPSSVDRDIARCGVVAQPTVLITAGAK